MTRNTALSAGLCLLLSVSLATTTIAAQGRPSAAETESLRKTVTALDEKLFDAYNRCDLATLGAMVTDDLEFYHDQTGLAVGKAVFLESIRKNICGKVHRDLVQGTIEIYPLKGYGAVELGIHRFHHPEQSESEGGDAKFVTVWQQKDGIWRVARVISYDHASLAK